MRLTVKLPEITFSDRFPCCSAPTLFPHHHIGNVNMLWGGPFLIRFFPPTIPREIITINYGCNARWGADKKWSLGIHLALVNFPQCCQFMITHPNGPFYARLVWCMRRRVRRHFLSLFFPPLPSERKSMGGHEEAIGYVCFSGKQARVCTQHDSPGPRSSLLCGAPEGPECTTHTGRSNSTPTHHFRQSRDLSVPAGVRFVVFLFLSSAAGISDHQYAWGRKPLDWAKMLKFWPV